MPVAYVDYKTLDDEFYTLKRVCHLLEFDKLTLKEKCEAYAIRPQRNEVGEWGLTRYDLRKLHHTLYHDCLLYTSINSSAGREPSDFS